VTSKHVFIGSTDGVKCKICGKEFTHEEYLELISDKPKTPKKKVNSQE